MNARRAARATRAREPTPPDDGLPAEFRVGRCVEVWAPEKYVPQNGPYPVIPLAVLGRFSRALAAYAESVGARVHDVDTPSGGPWSVEFSIEAGREEAVTARFAHAGLALADIPHLRRAANAWL